VHAVCFDLDGTLLHPTRPYGDVLRDAIVDVVGDCRDDWLTTYDQAFFQRFHACEPRPVERAFAEAMPDADAAALADALLEREIEMLTPAPGLSAYLDSITDQGHSVGVVTNGVPHWQRAKLEANGLLGAMDAVVASYEAGAHKPDPEPFRLAEDRLDAAEYLMIGDDDADVDGAKTAGWHAMRYDGDGFDSIGRPSFD